MSTIGGSVADPSADSQGNINIIEAAAKKGVKKFILVRRVLFSATVLLWGNIATKSASKGPSWLFAAADTAHPRFACFL